MDAQRIRVAGHADCESIATKNYPFAEPRPVTGTAKTNSLPCPPVFIDTFAGCGGLSLGLMRAGWKGLFAIEKKSLCF